MVGVDTCERRRDRLGMFAVAVGAGAVLIGLLPLAHRLLFVLERSPAIAVLAPTIVGGGAVLGVVVRARARREPSGRLDGSLGLATCAVAIALAGVVPDPDGLALTLALVGFGVGWALTERVPGTWVVLGGGIAVAGLPVLSARSGVSVAMLVLCGGVYLAAVVRGLARDDASAARPRTAPAPAGIGRVGALLGATALVGLVAAAPSALADERGWAPEWAAALAGLALVVAALGAAGLGRLTDRDPKARLLRPAALLAGVLTAMAAAASAGTVELLPPLVGLAVVFAAIAVALVRIGPLELCIAAPLGAVLAESRLGTSLVLAIVGGLALAAWGCILASTEGASARRLRHGLSTMPRHAVAAEALAEAAPTHEDAPERT